MAYVVYHKKHRAYFAGFAKDNTPIYNETMPQKFSRLLEAQCQALLLRSKGDDYVQINPVQYGN